MDIKKIIPNSALQSPTFHKIVIAVGVVVLFLIVFQAGVFVGFRKAEFSFRGGDNYYRAFGEDRRGIIPGMMHEEFPGANGSIGKVLSIALPIIVIEDEKGVEKTIRMSDKTVIRRGRETLPSSDLRTNDMLVVLGNPNTNAEIEATLVRLLPPPPGFKLQSSSMITNTTTPTK